VERGRCASTCAAGLRIAGPGLGTALAAVCAGAGLRSDRAGVGQVSQPRVQRAACGQRRRSRRGTHARAVCHRDEPRTLRQFPAHHALEAARPGFVLRAHACRARSRAAPTHNLNVRVVTITDADTSVHPDASQRACTPSIRIRVLTVLGWRAHAPPTNTSARVHWSGPARRDRRRCMLTYRTVVQHVVGAHGADGHDVVVLARPLRQPCVPPVLLQIPVCIGCWCHRRVRTHVQMLAQTRLAELKLGGVRGLLRCWSGPRVAHVLRHVCGGQCFP